ncbi:MAG: conjugal transfer protein TraX [Lachnospiraceae bacterium]|nr:conjugal transfer protein TraX [Lachnospiraceae bacterium]
MRDRGIAGSTLKLIAMICMLIDHIGAVIVWGVIEASYAESATAASAAVTMADLFNCNPGMVILYYIMRSVGRIAFPIFCFLLVEGFVHTRSRKKYALRLLLFALVSEIPFDLANKAKLIEFSYQNVFFTLFIGLLAICVLEEVSLRFGETVDKRTLYGTNIAVTAAAMLAAYYLKTDYSLFGVLAIVIMYLFKEQKKKGMLYGCVVLIIQSFLELFALVDIALVGMYNGKRGLKFKYLFYIFYPAHLIALYYIAVRMGIIT